MPFLTKSIVSNRLNISNKVGLFLALLQQVRLVLLHNVSLLGLYFLLLQPSLNALFTHYKLISLMLLLCLTLFDMNSSGLEPAIDLLLQLLKCLVLGLSVFVY